MKADVTAENRPACTPKRTNEHRDRCMRDKNTHEDQGGVQVFIILLHKVSIVPVGFTLKLVVEFDAGAAGSSKKVRNERWQRLEHCILQTGKQKRGKPKFGDGGSVGRTPSG